MTPTVLEQSYARGREPAPALSGLPADLRAFIRKLDEAGRLRRIDRPVHWKCELGAIARAHREPLLFENIRDYPGQRILTNGLSHPSLIALALGFDPALSRGALLTACRARLSRPLEPVIAASAPFLENLFEGRDLDLFQLAVPQWSPSDAGRYLGTWHINVTRDPETGARNVGVYRMQLLSANRATVSASAGSGFAAHFAKAEKRGRPLPMAVAIGVPEAVMIAAGAACPPAMDEYALAGALQQAPVALHPCTALDLEVPASSEFVIEGHVLPGIRVQDGPYFDYCGVDNVDRRAYLFEAHRILFRSEPIFRGAAIGVPGAEDHQLFAFLARLDLLDFHGPRMKQRLQNVFWKRRRFRAVQWLGRIGGLLPTALKKRLRS